MFSKALTIAIVCLALDLGLVLTWPVYNEIISIDTPIEQYIEHVRNFMLPNDSYLQFLLKESSKDVFGGMEKLEAFQKRHEEAVSRGLKIVGAKYESLQAILMEASDRGSAKLAKVRNLAGEILNLLHYDFLFVVNAPVERFIIADDNVDEILSYFGENGQPPQSKSIEKEMLEVLEPYMIGSKADLLSKEKLLELKLQYDEIKKKAETCEGSISGLSEGEVLAFRKQKVNSASNESNAELKSYYDPIVTLLDSILENLFEISRKTINA